MQSTARETNKQSMGRYRSNDELRVKERKAALVGSPLSLVRFDDPLSARWMPKQTQQIRRRFWHDAWACDRNPLCPTISTVEYLDGTIRQIRERTMAKSWPASPYCPGAFATSFLRWESFVAGHGQQFSVFFFAISTPVVWLGWKKRAYLFRFFVLQRR